MGRIPPAGAVLLLTSFAISSVLGQMSGHGVLFGPLACNENITEAPWEKWTETELPATSTNNVVEVPCGRRILMDLTGAITFGGLVVHGHLKFEDNGIHITTDHVIVQGFLTIGEHQNPVTNQVMFTLTGTTEPDVAVLEAVRDDCNGFCIAGIQAFATIGGVLDLHGMPYDSAGSVCPTWLELQALDSTEPQTPGPADPAIAAECGAVFENGGFEAAPVRLEIPTTCGGGKVFKNWNMEEPSPLPTVPAECGDNLIADGGLESGLTGQWHHTRGSVALEIDSSTSAEGSYSLHVPSPSSRVGQYIPNASSCLSAGVDYVFSAMIKLPPGASCYDPDENHRSCPWAKLTYTDASGASVTSGTLGDVEGQWGTDGEWNLLYIAVRFTQEQLDSAEFFLYIDVSGDSEFWLDDLRLFQPPTPPVHWSLYSGSAFLETVHDAGAAQEGESFLRISRRVNTWSRAAQTLDVSCLTPGVHYLMSAWVRIDADNECFSGGSCPSMALRYRGTDNKHKYTTLARPVSGYVPGGWMELRGDEIFEAGDAHFWAGTEHVVYFHVAGEADYDLDAVKMSLPEQAPAPGWEKRGEHGGFLGVVTDGTAYEGDSHLRVYGRDSSGDYVFQNLGSRRSCLQAAVPYVISVMVRLPTGAPCFASDSQCPYLQVRTGHQGGQTTRWLGDIHGSQGTDGEWNALWAVTTFSAEELAADEFTRIEVIGGGTADYFVDKAEIVLAPQAPNSADPCDNLIKNGDLDAHHGSWAPWSVGGRERLVPTGGVDGGAYILNFDRSSKYHGPGQYVDVGCVQTGAVYAFTASTLLSEGHPCTVDGSDCPRMVIRSTTNGRHNYEVFTQGGAEAGVWSEFTWEYQFSEEDAGADSVYVYVEGGAVGWDCGFDKLSLRRVSLGRNALIVDARAADGCWAAGDELVVTSSDTRRDHSERRTVTMVEDLGDGRARVTVDSNLQWMHEGAGLWHAEVMVLTRRILIHGTEWAPSKGGHFWVSHTPAIQTIEGVELHTMGQQGTLGRYPMHLHMCQDTPGSTIASISVHDTFQRCVVVHGTDNSIVRDSVAFNTIGHCFFLEDGYEEGTQFLHNIGAMTNAVPMSGLISGETDNDPATFWISNPNNTFIGNVAAGSERSGYWYELRNEVRGPSAHLHKSMHYFGEGQPLRPQHHHMGVFRDNRAHSNNGNGLQTYPSHGYNPRYGWADFDNFVTFRNRQAGLRFHISDHCRATGLLSADNRRGVDDDRNHDIEILDSTVIGVSDAFRGKAHGVCPGSPALGVDLHQQSRSGESRGTILSNIAFSGFDPAECAGSVAIIIDEEQQTFWDPRHVVSGLTFDADSRRAYLPTYTVEDLRMGDELSDAQKQVTIHDADGSLMGVPGYLVANNPDIVDLASCTLHGADDALLTNLYTCPGACYRARHVAVPAMAESWPGMEQPKLEVSWVDSTGATKSFVLDGTSSSTSSNRNQDSRRHHFFVVLPSGFDVTARLVVGGQTASPLFVEEPLIEAGGYADSDPACGGEFKSFTLDVGSSSACGELMGNGGLESGNDDWWAVRGMRNGPPVVVHDPAGAAGGSHYLRMEGSLRPSSWQGATQFIPMAKMREGELYRFQLQVRQPNHGADETDRLRLSFMVMTEGLRDKYLTVASADVAGNGWVALDFEFEWTAEFATAQSVVWYISGLDGGEEVHYDELSLRMAGECVDCQSDSDCDDGDACTGVETCSQGFCHMGTTLTCDDGLWCNGLETCDASSGCVAGAAPTCGGNTPFCNDETDACECSSDADCDTGLFCAPAECQAGQCVEVSHTCGGDTPLCKEETDECVGHCEVDGVCDFPYETAAGCPQDCTTIQPSCGNGVCEPWGLAPETCSSCPDDCSNGGIACKPDAPVFVCGNGLAEPGETCGNCPADAPAVTEDTLALCTDGLDNDCNGLLDRDEPACAVYVSLSVQADGRAAGSVGASRQDGDGSSGPLVGALVACGAVFVAALAVLAVRRQRRQREERADADRKLGVISEELMFDVQNNLKQQPVAEQGGAGAKRQLEDAPNPATSGVSPSSRRSRPTTPAARVGEMVLDMKEIWRSQFSGSKTNVGSNDVTVSTPLAHDGSGVWKEENRENGVTVV